jgi:signal transduction histidine kinase
MPTIKVGKEASTSWESFVSHWERANLIRGFFWNQRFVDENVLLTHFLARLRRFFSVDFCFCSLVADAQRLVEVGQPSAELCKLPKDFSRRCMDLIVNSSTPVSWHNDLSPEFGYRTTVVAPLAPPVGRSFGFLMLGHARRKSYSAQDLFLLQSLAGELTRTVRELAVRKRQQRQRITTSHDVKNALQVIMGNAALIYHRAGEPLQSEFEKRVQGIESSVQQITDSMNTLEGLLEADDNDGPIEDFVSEAVVEVSSAISQSVASCRNVARERGVNLEVVYPPNSLGNPVLVPATFKRVLRILVDHAASATRNESIRFTVRREDDDLEVGVMGMESNCVADRLKWLFEPASRSGGARGKSRDGLIQVRKYLDHTGGDVYLKSRPGEPAEFIVCVPIESAVQSGRGKFGN